MQHRIRFTGRYGVYYSEWFDDVRDIQALKNDLDESSFGFDHVEDENGFVVDHGGGE